MFLHEDVVKQFHAVKFEQTVTIAEMLHIRARADKKILCCLFLVYLAVDLDFIKC